MKALALAARRAAPETLRLTEVADPRARARASCWSGSGPAAINYPDVLIIEDKYQFKPPRPFAPGGEIAGEVEAVGEGVEGWSVGDRLIAVHRLRRACREGGDPGQRRRCALPDERSFEEGAALLLTYATRSTPCSIAAGLQAGQTLLVLGAAGGVGLAAVELGKAYGARVIAAVSSEEKAQAAREAGADEAIVYPRGPVRQGRRRRRSPSSSRRRSARRART